MFAEVLIGSVQIGYSKNEKFEYAEEPIHSLITIFTRADLKIGLIHRLVILTTITRLLISEDIVDHVANMYFITDDDRDAVEFVDEFFKLFPCFTLGKMGYNI